MNDAYRNRPVNDPLVIAGLGGYIVAIDRWTGQNVWRHDLHDARANHIREGTTVIPAVEPPFAAALSISCLSGSDQIYNFYVRALCCDYASGRVHWTVAWELQGHRTVTPSLQIQNGVVLLGCANLIAFEATSGRHLWSTAVVQEPHAPPSGGGLVDALKTLFDASTAKPWNCQIARRHG